MTHSPAIATSWDAVSLENHFVSHTDADPIGGTMPRQVHQAMYSRVSPTPVKAPKVMAFVSEVAEQLNLAPSLFSTPEAANVFSGNALLAGSDPYAAAYGGHQFGHWAGQLGDGRAIALGERVGQNGDRFELQLKGAGPTPYSRSADGRAVLRSSVREYLMSEAMHHLGIPTTRALTLVTTGDEVMRDMLYDGNPAPEPGAIVCRVAPTFLRFGNFQLFAARNELDQLRTLTDYAIETHFPAIAEAHAPNSDARILAFLQEVTRRTAFTVSEWMRVGFVHGVMNTDNLSILGLTIDYGPYGWMDAFDPSWTPNTTDAQHRRYRFGHQPQIALWNLARFAEALHPLLHDKRGASAQLEDALGVYATAYEAHQDKMWAAKLGLDHAPVSLVEELVGWLVRNTIDMTIFFRNLAAIDVTTTLDSNGATSRETLAPLLEAVYGPVDDNMVEELAAWCTTYGKVVQQEAKPVADRNRDMLATNPKYVLRNYLAQLAIDAATENDVTVLDRLAKVLKRPYTDQPDADDLFAKRPEWARNKPGCSMLSCSS